MLAGRAQNINAGAQWGMGVVMDDLEAWRLAVQVRATWGAASECYVGERLRSAQALADTDAEARWHAVAAALAQLANDAATHATD